jgi:hypothetical protein
MRHRHGEAGNWDTRGVPLEEHRVPTEYTWFVENSNLLLPEEDFYPEQILTGRVAPMRPFLIPAPEAGIRTRHFGAKLGATSAPKSLCENLGGVRGNVTALNPRAA